MSEKVRGFLSGGRDYLTIKTTPIPTEEGFGPIKKEGGLSFLYVEKPWISKKKVLVIK